MRGQNQDLLNAVALQDHIARSIGMPTHITLKREPRCVTTSISARAPSSLSTAGALFGLALRGRVVRVYYACRPRSRMLPVPVKVCPLTEDSLGAIQGGAAADATARNTVPRVP